MGQKYNRWISKSNSTARLMMSLPAKVHRQREVVVLGASVGQHDDRNHTKKPVRKGPTAVRTQSPLQLLVPTVEISRLVAHRFLRLLLGPLPIFVGRARLHPSWQQAISLLIRLSSLS